MTRNFWKDGYLPGDFKTLEVAIAQEAAAFANAILKAELEKARTVTGRVDQTYRPWSADGEQKPDDTHSAKLVRVEETRRE